MPGWGRESKPRRDSFAFGETAESCGFCASRHPLQFSFAPLYDTSKNCKERFLLREMVSPTRKSSRPNIHAAGHDKSAKGLPPARALLGFDSPNRRLIRRFSGMQTRAANAKTARTKEGRSDWRSLPCVCQALRNTNAVARRQTLPSGEDSPSAAFMEVPLSAAPFLILPPAFYIMAVRSVCLYAKDRRRNRRSQRIDYAMRTSIQISS